MLNPSSAAGVPPIPENVSVENKVWHTLTAIEVDKESELRKVHKKGDKITYPALINTKLQSALRAHAVV